MARTLVLILGLVLAGCSLLAAALPVRFEEAGDLERLLGNDLVIGFLTAVAALLVGPSAAGVRSVRRVLATGVVAGLAWVLVSGGLAWSHTDQWRERLIDARQPDPGPVWVIWASMLG